MSLGSESHRGNVVVSAPERPLEITTPQRSGDDVAGYKAVLGKHEAFKESLPPVDPNARNKTRASPDLLIYANSEYVYATSPIAIPLFWERAGGGICQSEPLSVIFFTTLAHCVNETATNNYSVRTDGNGLVETRFKRVCASGASRRF